MKKRNEPCTSSNGSGKKNHRFWSSTTLEHREILNLTTNEYGDFIFTLDGGEIWQFTPHHDIKIDDIEIERIHVMGRGKDCKTGAPSIISFLTLKNPKTSYTGNIRILSQQPIPKPEPEAKPAKEPLQDHMSIAEAATYVNRTERTIRTWLQKMNGDKHMLQGVIWNGKIPRIPRTSLDPWRKPAKKKPIKKPVK